MKGSRDISPERMNRRDFIKMGTASAALIGGVSCSAEKKEAGDQVKSEAIVPKKQLGRTSIIASTLAMGGGSALSMIKKDEDALALIDLARRKGVNYFDSGAGYGEGKSEMRFGEALEGHRSEIYFSTKYSASDTPDKLRKKVETSLKRFRTDYIDVGNIHGLSKMGDVESMFSSGALETLVKLKEEGLVKYIGFTSHNNPLASAEALKRFDFDVILLAANASKVPFFGEFETPIEANFEDTGMPLALQKGVGVWSFKVTGQRRLIQKNDEQEKAPGAELLRYAMSLPSHGIVLGMHTTEHVISAAEMAAGFTPMTKEEMRSWNERLAAHANELTLDYLRDDYIDDGGYRAHLA
jgi:uncharacterized protein